MDSEKKTDRCINPRQYANLFSKISFWYTINLFKKGFKHELEEEDLYEVLPEFESCNLGDRVEHEWEQQKHRKNAMFVIFWKMFGPYYCILSLNMLFYIIFHVIRPMIIRKLVHLMAYDRKESEIMNIYLYSSLLILLLLIALVCRHNYFFLTENLIIKIRTAICTLVYRKLLRLPTSRLRYILFGNITNLITRDINAFDQFFINFSYGWASFITIIITCCNMYQSIGLPTLIVIVVLTILIPIQVFIGIWIASLKKQTCDETDTRIAILQEGLSNVKSIKMYVWEKHMEERISAIRKEETRLYLKVIVVLFSTIIIGIAAANVTYYFVLMTYIWFGKQLSSETIYYITGAFTSFIFSFSVAIPYAVYYAAQVVAAIKRMQTLVQQLEPESELKKINENNHPKIKLEDVTVTVADKMILDNVNLNIERGLTLVTGPAGSGKSILLMTLLKEFEIFKGNLNVEGRISYASQEPWLFPSTIRQNILFGSNYDHKRYQDVIKACDLQYDFDLLVNGDLTIVADRGSNLSKGQQSRINLARAIYKKSDIYLLDDCLSSLDSLVARFIFTNCILKFLRDKIVLLVSHNSNLVLYATRVLKLCDGHVQSCRNDCPKLADDLVNTAVPTAKLCGDKFETEPNEISDKKKLISTKKTHKIYGETKTVGAVPFKIYQTVVNLGGGTFFILMVFCLYLLGQYSVSYKDKLIGDWANLEDMISQINKSAANNLHYLNLINKRNDLTMKFAVTVVAICFTALIRGIALFYFCKTVSINIHNNMLRHVVNAALLFFDTTFIGNIINRFSKDLVAVDEGIPFPLHHLSAILFETAGNVFIIVSTNIRMLIPTILLFISFVLLRHVYLKTGRPLKRLDALTKSPVIGYLQSTLEGLLSIKVFRAETILKHEFEKHHNLYNSASFSHSACLKAFVFAVDICVTIFVAIVIFQFVIFNEGVLPADFGLAVSQALIMGTELNFALYKAVELETQMTSVERAIEYTNIKKETKTGLQIKDFPEKAEIKFENVCLSVKSKTHLLKNINFYIKPQGKLGIIGRTGAGKSSLIAALFRLYEFKGKITIDGINIKTLSLSFLRSRISVVPQDSILLDGSLRDNIDPQRKYKDGEIWTALETVKLKELVKTLHMDIKELNLTCGQKQLISLARVLISNNKILVLDEMVANVDFETERLIYDIINTHFTSCTIIKIAHKLRFVMDCDKILVVDNGEIVECGNPNILLQNKNSLFYKMAQNSNINPVALPH